VTMTMIQLQCLDERRPERVPRASKAVFQVATAPASSVGSLPIPHSSRGVWPLSLKLMKQRARFLPAAARQCTARSTGNGAASTSGEPTAPQRRGIHISLDSGLSRVWRNRPSPTVSTTATSFRVL